MPADCPDLQETDSKSEDRKDRKRRIAYKLPALLASGFVLLKLGCIVISLAEPDSQRRESGIIGRYRYGS